MARRTVFALALLALAVPGMAAAKDRAHWTNYSRPATYGVARDANVAIPMSDGVTLRANVDRPDQPGKYATLVVQTPYNKDGVVNVALGGAFEYLVQRGYAVVTVDVRGTGASGASGTVSARPNSATATRSSSGRPPSRGPPARSGSPARRTWA